MSAFFIVIHVIACVLLILIILIQQGKGGGLVQSLSNVENMFGTKTSAFLTKATSILAIVFFITCLSLALLSAQKSHSLMKGYKGKVAPADAKTTTGEQAKTSQETTAKETTQALPDEQTAQTQKTTTPEETAKPNANKTGK